MKKRGRLFVITGPSGVGKGTVLEKFFQKNKESVCYSVSMTTRHPRPNETDGLNYFFVTRKEFEAVIQEGGFLEWAEYSGNLYGTSKKFVEDKLNEGLNVVLEIEAKGALKVMEKFPKCISIFLLPPSIEELESRLRGRHTEEEESILKRLDAVKKELEASSKYKYKIINNKVEEAIFELQKIYEKECEK